MKRPASTPEGARTGARSLGSALLGVLLAAALPRPATASPGDTYGALPRGTATAGAQTAAGADTGAAFYNPANLAYAGATGHASVQIGYAAGLPYVSVHRDNSDPATLQQYPTVKPPADGWMTLGTLVPIGGKIRNNASLGLIIYIPQNNLIRVESLSPQNPQWLRYQANTDRLVLALGLGVRLGKYLAVGAGFHMLAGLTGTVATNADLFTKQVTERNMSVDLDPAFAATAGVTFSPYKNWRFSIAYRSPLQVNVHLPTQIGLGDLGSLSILLNGIVDYSPHQLAVGAAIPLAKDLSATANLTWEHWSAMPNPSLQINVTTGGALATGLGLDKVLGFQTNDAPPGFADTVTPAVALEYAVPGQIAIIRGGYAFRPTYVPNQVGSTNFLDADAHIVGLGGTLQFHDPFDWLANTLKFDIAAQGQFLDPRSVVKSQAADPVGNYSIGGTVVALGASLRYDF